MGRRGTDICSNFSPSRCTCQETCWPCNVRPWDPPLPRVAWTLDGGPLPPSRRLRQGDFVGADGNIISFVNISGVAVPDGGMYGCEAHNKAGAVRHQAKIDVFGPPFIRPMNITSIAGQSVQVRCPVAGYPIDTVAIYRGGSRRCERFSLDDRGSLTIHSLKKDDAGAYRCSAVNGRGEKAEGDVFLRVVGNVDTKVITII
ncbi:hypothetical protein LAZ67_1006193 [Cordylochernes scorpioides]|uniref:Ig-like domain-containing protein n=1 Tax=Cordylochernes scorpioides TaxID=51811 RepID=A0ABY6JZD7_9ARAC|nr:hypothetical protein LAZ67_1006193 [Cordylochernes scorpioides]